jgi:amino-acid N-acetyltransferase
VTGSFVIRAARAADQATIVGLVRAARLDPSNLHWPNFVVAEADGQIVGCGQIRPDPGLRELGSMVVIKPYRQRGVGAAIVRALQASAPPPLYLECPAYRVSFYAQFGFQVVPHRVVPWKLRLKATLGNLLLPLMRGPHIVTMRWDGENSL